MNDLLPGFNLEPAVSRARSSRQVSPAKVEPPRRPALPRPPVAKPKQQPRPDASAFVLRVMLFARSLSEDRRAEVARRWRFRNQPYLRLAQRR